ncbi:hypothetical protein BV898_16082 [Hypsibius exemplaris]|uniref:Uncharacterized protein n=1 Tax=Hypsibius exemplaris TaxID=2072580 RepID=A0A9X6RL88_HYPEX|nr:hypothetical protein BV898_16082 [Hypsibius exemplaris]
MLTNFKRLAPTTSSICFIFRNAATASSAVKPEGSTRQMGILDAELNRRKVAVRTLPGDEFLDLTFSYGETGSSVRDPATLIQLSSSKNETLSRTLERISQVRIDYNGQ